jgi:hypothetical protein
MTLARAAFRMLTIGRTEKSMSEASSKEYAVRLDLYEKLIATNPKVKRQGATVPFTSVNGHMFSYLGKTGELALRLPEGEREAFLKKYKTALCQQYGIVQKEYVTVPETLLSKTQELKMFFDLSHAYASSLKPKPAKKKKS